MNLEEQFSARFKCAKCQSQGEDRGGGARWRAAKHPHEMDEVDAHRASHRTPAPWKSFDLVPPKMERAAALAERGRYSCWSAING